MDEEGILTEPPEKKVIAPDDPIAKAIVAHRANRPTRIPMRFRGSRLGELAVEEAYIYPPPMVFVFEYRRRGQTTHWEAVDPGQCVPCAPDDRWTDAEVRVEQQGGRVVIRVYSEEALEEADATPAEELANEELQKRFPGHTIDYPRDED
jgi:hypothetical protein